MFKIRNIILVLTMLGTVVLGQVKVYVRTQQEIYAGEPFRMDVVAENSKAAPEVNPSELKGFNPSFLNSSMGSSSSKIIINGKVIEDKSEYVSSWQLSVDDAGQYTIPALSVTVDGSKYKTDPVSISVTTPETSDLIGLEAEISSTECYVGQPLAFNIKWYVSSSLAGYNFNIPDIMDESKFSSGNLTPNTSSKLQQIDNTSLGTLIVSQTPVTYKDNRSNLIEFSKYLVPRQTGKININPISVTCKLETTSSYGGRRGFFDDPFRQRSYSRYQAAAEPITLNVKPLPAENKPDGFYGLVGRKFFIMTELMNAPDNISVGTPLTIKMTISGNGNILEDVKMPDMSEIANSFKIPSDFATPETTEDGIIFTQTIRPLKSSSDGLTEIPSIKVPYFNYTTEKYEIAESKTIPINIDGARRILEADAVNTVTSQPAQATELNKIEHKIAANHYGNQLLVNTKYSVEDSVKSIGGIAALGGPVMMIVLAGMAAGSKDPEKQKAKRAGKALCKATAAISGANKSAENYTVLITDGMRDYIGDKFAAQAQSLTGQDCYEKLTASGIDEEKARRFKQIVELGEHSRYAGSFAAGAMPEKTEIVSLLKAVDKEIR